MLDSTNTVILDLETLHSADDCQHCGVPRDGHSECSGECGFPHITAFAPVGWGNKAALGLSIGCYWQSQDARMYWFDEHNLENIMQYFVETQPLIVSFNGLTFDLPLLRGLLRRRAALLPSEEGAALVALCDAFKLLSAQGYDILQNIWAWAPIDRFTRGLNSLDAIALANGLGGKTGHGAQAPRDWAAGKYASVIEYCQNDVYLTKSLFEMILRGQPILRHDGSMLMLPLPVWPQTQVPDGEGA